MIINQLGGVVFNLLILFEDFFSCFLFHKIQNKFCIFLIEIFDNQRDKFGSWNLY